MSKNPLPLGARLLATAADPRHRVVLTALIEEEHILALDAVQRSLAWDPGDGTVACSWDHLSAVLHDLGLDDFQRAFLDLLLSATGVLHATSLARVIGLDERRLAILLRAIVRLSGCDTIAVGTRT
ncbi:hypothetical protein ACJWDR_28750 [Streptomyces tauricus]|uniref:hypothetical protein n=1 Tax=Streptomyces tauricus TaxID=68274 RepID=UPI00387F03C3